MSDDHVLIEMARLGRRPPGRPLRVGFLSSDTAVPRWMAETAQILSGAPSIEICGAVVHASGGGASRSAKGLGEALFDRYQNASRRFSEAFDPVSIESALRCGLPMKLAGHEALRHLAALDLDVAISLDSRLPPGPYEGVSRHGVWNVVWGDPRNPLPDPPFFWEVYRGERVTRAALVQHSADCESARILREIVCATAFSLYYTKNAIDAPAAMKRILIDSLYGLRVNEPASGELVSIRRAGRGPGPLQLSVFLAKRAATSLVSSRLNRRTYGQWFAAARSTPEHFTHKRERFSPVGFEELPLRGPGYGCADPHPVHWRGGDYIFAEEILPGGRGRLVVYERNDAGGWKNPPEVILDAAHHLAYPCIFEHGGEFFLIPESSQTRRVELWRAEVFPHKWVLDTICAENVCFVDTTPFLAEDGTWYFFTSACTPRSGMVELMLYYSGALRGPWTAHPANPISSDVRRSRMAGRLFRRGGKLIRPAQDCSGPYGRAIRLFEIERLSTGEYAEREIEVIDPGWHPHSERTHTLNATDTVETIDGWKRYPRR